jgi:hypothetical protein
MPLHRHQLGRRTAARPQRRSLEFYTREEVLPLLMPGERVERIPAFTAEGYAAGADLPGR